MASHIKPWSQSNDKERLDVNNGLLLVLIMMHCLIKDILVLMMMDQF